MATPRLTHADKDRIINAQADEIAVLRAKVAQLEGDVQRTAHTTTQDNVLVVKDKRALLTTLREYAMAGHTGLKVLGDVLFDADGNTIARIA